MMNVLDIDLDYFLDFPVYEADHNSDERIELLVCRESVWSEERVRNFIENNLGLNKESKVLGRILKGHSMDTYT